MHARMCNCIIGYGKDVIFVNQVVLLIYCLGLLSKEMKTCKWDSKGYSGVLMFFGFYMMLVIPCTLLLLPFFEV